MLQRCRRLTSLFLAHTRLFIYSIIFKLKIIYILELNNNIIQSIEWEKTKIEELDIRATELNAITISSVLTRLPHLRWLDASWLENFTDEVCILKLK